MDSLSMSYLGVPVLVWIMAPLLVAIVLAILLRSTGYRTAAAYATIAGSFASIAFLLFWNYISLWHYLSMLFAGEELEPGAYAAISILAIGGLIGAFLVWSVAADTIKGPGATRSEGE